MKVINLFGGSGAGKSTTASGLFFLMKQQGLSVELVSEYAKELTWDEQFNLLRNQPLILGEQNRRLSRLEGKVDYAIVDSPLLLSVVYGDYYKTETSDSFYHYVHELVSRYDNENFYIHRVKVFNLVGRNETEEQSDEVSRRVRLILNNSPDDFISVEGDYLAPWVLYRRIIGTPHPLRGIMDIQGNKRLGG